MVQFLIVNTLNLDLIPAPDAMFECARIFRRSLQVSMLDFKFAWILILAKVDHLRYWHIVGQVIDVLPVAKNAIRQAFVFLLNLTHLVVGHLELF